MVREETKPYGYIYRAENRFNRKNYIGKTYTDRWDDNQNPVDERWKEECNIAYNKQRRGEELRYIENAIIKNGPENFNIFELDTATNQEELNAKEKHWVSEYDTTNPEKGYNMTEGGDGGKPIPEVIEKMTRINQEIARNPETREKMSRTISEKWKDQQYQENVSQGVTNKWQEAKYRERQFISRKEGKREIPDIREFLRDIRDMKKKDINEKYDMDGKCTNKRIKEMLGHRGVKNYSEAKKHLEGKNLDVVLKDINEKQKEHPQRFDGKKEISNLKEFLEDIQRMKSKEIEEKYNMNRATINKRIHEMLGEHRVKNYTEARKYVSDKKLDDVVKDISDRMSDETKKYKHKTLISDKREFLEVIVTMQKNEIDEKYVMTGKTVNNKIREILGDYGVMNYSDAREFLKDKDLDEVLKDIEERSAEAQKGNLISQSKSEESIEGLKDDREEGRKEGHEEENNDKYKGLEEDEKSDDRKQEYSQENVDERLDKEGEEYFGFESMEESELEESKDQKVDHTMESFKDKNLNDIVKDFNLEHP
ncbi:MAG: GIY-YIG nuclease family protein [Promethearchaeota archaeon]